MPQDLSIFTLAQRGMSAQLVRMNAAASNLANAGSVASSDAAAYRPVRAVFAADLDQASGLSTVRVERMMREETAATRRHEPGHPMADANGDVWESGVNETAEMVEIMESARQYQNLVEAMQTAKQLMLETLKEQMMEVAPIDKPQGVNSSAIAAPQTVASGTGLGSLGQADFLKLMIAQLQQQDPLEPVDNKEMLAQMAQFSTLAGSAETNSTLSKIVARLDTLIDAQTPPLTDPIKEPTP